MVMEYLIKCGVRVYGGNGNGTLISKILKRVRSLVWILLWFLFYLPVEVVVHYLRSFGSYYFEIYWNLMFDDREKGWPWTERVVSSHYACT